jgi:hypothetical protein
MSTPEATDGASDLPPPALPIRCSNPDCALPSGGRCAREAEVGEPLLRCPDLARVADSPQSPVNLRDHEIEAPTSLQVQPDLSTQTPWTGQAMDTDEVERLLLRSPARLIAVLGPHRSGKTCLLTAFFLELAQGQRRGFPYRFAGSRSLVGLRTLCQRAAGWKGDEAQEIVEYTKISEGDQPRLFLHLGLRPEAPSDDRLIDLLLTDIPGEWVEDQAQVLDDRARRRLGWLERADAFLVLADAAALLEPAPVDASAQANHGPDPGQDAPRMSRNAVQADVQAGKILRRITDIARQRPSPPPIGLVLTKFDRVVDRVLPPADAAAPPESWGPLAAARRTWSAVQQARRVGIEVRPFAVSAFPWPLDQGHPVGVMAPFAWAMGHVDRTTPWLASAPPIPTDAMSFQAVRRRGPS